MNPAASLKVGFDLDGSLESLGNSMVELGDALEATGECTLVRFRTRQAAQQSGEVRLPQRSLWLPLWRRSLGRSLDGLLPPVDVVHLAGLATPPSKVIPLVISVDDLRPLRGETRLHQRAHQLKRAVEHGARIVASTRTASHEVQEVLGIERSQITVVSPVVPKVHTTVDGRNLVVNVTGLTDRFLTLAPELVRFASSKDALVIVVASAKSSQQIRSRGLDIVTLPRERAREALGEGWVVLHISDGARFPSFAIAALAAGVPTLARSTSINRELLGGAAALVESDHDTMATLSEVWENQSYRAVLQAAGQIRATDFDATTVARAYVALYRDVVRGW